MLDLDETDPINIAAKDEKHNEKSQTTERVDAETDYQYTALGARELPDWRPKNLQVVVAVTSCYVLCVTTLYVILYIVSKAGRRYIATKEVSLDWIFEYGPAFLAVILGEILEQASMDLASLEPYMRFGQREPRQYIRWNEHIVEPAVKELLSSVLRSVICLPFEARLHFASVFCVLIIVPSL